MSEAVNASIQAITEMEAACARFAGAVIDRLPGVANELRQVSEELEERRGELRGQIRRLRDEVESADPEEDTGHLERMIEAAQEEQDRVRRRMRRLEEAALAYRREALQLELLTGEGMARARAYLLGAAADLRAYFAATLDGGGAGGSGGGGGSAGAADASGIAPVGLFDLARMPLPEGYVWVLLREVDRSPERGGFAGEPEFRKGVAREEMARGFAALQAVILPAIAGLGAAQVADWCAAYDQRMGHTAENGIRRVFDAFFGEEPIYLSRGREAALFDVTNGRHRSLVAAELGWPAVPARVSDLRAP